MTTTCFVVWTLALLLLPVLFIAWLLETPAERAQRMRSYGWSQQRIADRLGVSRYRVRKLLTA
jgi:DNA-binding CsgD family transcriptional regulator